MRGTAGRTVLLVMTLSTLWASNAQAYRRLRFGPFEIVPQFAVDIRQHSNVFVTSDEAAAGNPNSAKVSGVIIEQPLRGYPGMEKPEHPRFANRERLLAPTVGTPPSA